MESKLFTVFITIEGHDWNFIVRAGDEERAEELAYDEIRMSVTAKEISPEAAAELGIAGKDLPKKNGEVYLFDEGT